MKKNYCEVIAETETQRFNTTANTRFTFASSVKLNQSTMWITGGSFSDEKHLNSTEIVTVIGSKAGVNLPFTVFGHCMVQYQPDAILLIGGRQNGHTFDKTWIIDPTNGFEITEGPSLKKGRILHTCGKLEDKNGNVLVIVAGGFGIHSVEVLNTTTMQEWVKG